MLHIWHARKRRNARGISLSHSSSAPRQKQVAPGIPNNRPQSGAQPVRTVDKTHSGYATSIAETWYDNLTVAGNTSLNPFFYGTYLGVTKPNEPVTRNKNQAFQADAVGAMKQLVPEHFRTPHTFRVEWQPGRGGRIDWFTKSYKMKDENGTVFHMEGDGKGQDWEHSLSIPDFALENAMGSKIPEEPSYIIFNTAISSTWAFPYDVPDWCPKCYDCYNPKCACSFNPGFCNMMKTGKVALKIDAVRVYQSKDDNAHDGNPHTVGCDPPGFPTREFIKGYEYRYMRNPPFVFDDKHPLRKVKNGGGKCEVDEDCGGGGAENTDVDENWKLKGKTLEEVMDLDRGGGSAVTREGQSPLAHTDDNKKGQKQTSKNSRRLSEAEGGEKGDAQGDAKSESKDDSSSEKGDSTTEGDGKGESTDKESKDDSSSKKEDSTAGLDKPPIAEESLEDKEKDTKVLSNPDRKPKGQCVKATPGMFGLPTPSGKQCKCNEGYTGPNCLSIDKSDDEPGAYDLKNMRSLFRDWASPYVTRLQVFIGGTLFGAFLVALVIAGVLKSRNDRAMEMASLR